MATKRALVVEKVSPHYETYSEWLEEEHEISVPADYLQAALRYYAQFQKSDTNKAAKAERAKERAAEVKASKAAAKKSAKAKAAPADEDEEDDEDEEPAPPPAKKAPAKRAGRGSKAAF